MAPHRSFDCRLSENNNNKKNNDHDDVAGADDNNDDDDDYVKQHKIKKLSAQDQQHKGKDKNQKIKTENIKQASHRCRFIITQQQQPQPNSSNSDEESERNQCGIPAPSSKDLQSSEWRDERLADR